MDITGNVRNTISKMEQLIDEMFLFSQGKSNYLIDHGIIGMHDLPGRQREQVISELRARMFSVGDVVDEMELAKIDLDIIEINRSIPDDPTGRKTPVEIRKLKRRILACELHINGVLAECEHLLSLLEVMPKYTRSQYEDEEPEAWARRLSRQAVLARSGDFGNMDAVLQFMTTPGEPKPYDMSDNITAAKLYFKDTQEAIKRNVDKMLQEGKTSNEKQSIKDSN